MICATPQFQYMKAFFCAAHQVVLVGPRAPRTAIAPRTTVSATHTFANSNGPRLHEVGKIELKCPRTTKGSSRRQEDDNTGKATEKVKTRTGQARRERERGGQVK